jgi:hypothetical protein
MVYANSEEGYGTFTNSGSTNPTNEVQGRSYGTFPHRPEMIDNPACMLTDVCMADEEDEEEQDVGEERRSPIPLVELLGGVSLGRHRRTPTPDWDTEPWNILKHNRTVSWMSDPALADTQADYCTVDLSLELSVSGDIGCMIDSMDDQMTVSTSKVPCSA